MINQGHQLMTKKIRLNVECIIRYYKLATNSHVYATFNHFLVTNCLSFVVSHLSIFSSFCIH